LRAALRLEGAQLSLLLHRNKNLPAPRPGALELIRWCHENGIVVGIVSNTISGRGVREILARYGLTALIGPAAYSGPTGGRAPGASPAARSARPPSPGSSPPGRTSST